MIKFRGVTIFLLFLLQTACGVSMPYYEAKNDPFIKTNYLAADALIVAASKKAPVVVDAPILVATIVNVDYLDQSSRFGRIISEQLQARLTQQNFEVVELKLRGKLFVKKDQGELLLSREVKDISASQKAQAVVVGTYAVARSAVYVNLKIVGTDNMLLAAYDYTLPMTGNVKALLIKPCC